MDLLQCDLCSSGMLRLMRKPYSHPCCYKASLTALNAAVQSYNMRWEHGALC